MNSSPNQVQVEDEAVDTSLRRADVLFHNWDIGASALIDVAVCNSLQQQTMPHTNFKAMTPFYQAANRKIADYKDRVRALGHHFFPFVVGSLGGFCHDAVKVLQFLAAKLELTNGRPTQQSMAILRRRISCVVQKYQASAIMDRGQLADIMDI